MTPKTIFRGTTEAFIYIDEKGKIYGCNPYQFELDDFKVRIVETNNNEIIYSWQQNLKTQKQERTS